MNVGKPKQPIKSVDVNDKPRASITTAGDSLVETMGPMGVINSVLMNTELQSAPEPALGHDLSKIENLEPESLSTRHNEELERWSVLREMYRARVEMIRFYTSPEGGDLSMKEAIRLADRQLNGPEFKRKLKQIGAHNVDQVSWYSLHQVFINDPDCAEQIWQDIKQEAEKDYLGGHLVAQIFEATDWQRNPWKRAQFIAVRQGFIEQFQPQGAIDYSMIDMLAVSYFLWMHWTEEHLKRATTEPMRESTDYKQWREKEKETWCRHSGKNRPIEGQWIAGAWELPYQTEAEAIKQAAELADRFRRAYQSQLRAMRDWRRWNIPLTINNVEQVNIAADGGQQVNLQKSKEKRKSTKDHSQE